MYVGVQGRLVRPQPIDYGVTRGLVATLRGRYACLRSTVIGHSLLRREIPALVLGEDADVRVLMAAAFHGQEWMTTLCALRLCEEMCSHLRAELPMCGMSLLRALHGRQVWFVPLANPDGVEIARYGSFAAGAYAATAAGLGADIPGRWRGNAHGVDINSNFNAGWAEMQVLAEKSGKICGTHPESEPESRALADLCRRVPFRHVVALHTQGEEIYWRYGDHTPPQSLMMARVLSAVSGYAVADPAETSSHGGFKDWFIDCFHRPGFTLELGSGENPLPLREFETIYQKAREMLLLSVLL